MHKHKIEHTGLAKRMRYCTTLYYQHANYTMQYGDIVSDVLIICCTKAARDSALLHYCQLIITATSAKPHILQLVLSVCVCVLAFTMCLRIFYENRCECSV
jgi:hypothetical protein